MRDLICGVINCCASSFDAGTLSNRYEEPENRRTLKEIFHEFQSQKMEK